MAREVPFKVSTWIYDDILVQHLYIYIYMYVHKIYIDVEKVSRTNH